MVSVNDSRVFYKRMDPRMDWIEEEAKNAVRSVHIYLLQRITIDRQLQEEFQY